MKQSKTQSNRQFDSVNLWKAEYNWLRPHEQNKRFSVTWYEGGLNDSQRMCDSELTD